MTVLTFLIFHFIQNFVFGSCKLCLIKIYWNSFTYSWNLCQISPVYIYIMSPEWFDIFLHFSFAMLNIFENIILIIPLSFFLKKDTRFCISQWGLFSRCMKNLGSHHPHLALPLVPELLCLHPYFDTPEPDMDDAACILLVKKNKQNRLGWPLNICM